MQTNPKLIINKSSKNRKQARYSWNYNKMHPIAKCIYFIIPSLIVCKLLIKASWLIYALYYLTLQ